MTSEDPPTTRWLPPLASEPPPPEAPAPPPPEPPRLPIWLPFVALLAVLVIVNLIGVAVFGVLAAADPSIKEFDDLPEAAQLGLTLVQDVLFVLGAYVAVLLALGRAPREQFGLRRVGHPGRAVLWAAAVFAGFWLVTVVLTAIFGSPGDQELVKDVRAEDSLPALIGYGVLICIAAPVVEEVFFRGFMFTIFRRRLGVAWGSLLVGVVFGIGHAPAPAISLVALGAFGVGLCLLYWRTQSIIPGMALHALNNAITFGAVKSLEPGLFVAVVVCSVSLVVAGASAVAARSAVTA
jgi:membrane protease YdiL (CAAX protease family)